MMWYSKANLASMMLLLFAAVFIIGANLGVTADSHAEINDAVSSSMAEMDTAEPADGPDPYKHYPEFLTPDREAASSIATPLAKTAVQYGAKPIAHMVFSLSFVPLAVWKSIAFLPIGSSFLLSGYHAKQVISHG